MSEIEALLEFYGALDRAVVADEVKSEALAPLLGAYAGGAAKGWYDGQYLPWVEASKERAVLRERAEREHGFSKVAPIDVLDAPPAADVETAAEPAGLEQPAEEHAALSPHAEEVRAALSRFDPAQPIDGRRAARRLLAVAAAMRAYPQHFEPVGTHADVARAALTFEVVGEDTDPAAAGRRAERLHVRVAGQFQSMEDWSRVIGGAVDDGLPGSVRSQQTASLCTGRLIMRPDPITGDLDPCTVLEAEFTTNEVTFADAKRYLEPANWKFPGSLWCRMERDPDNSLLGPPGVTTWVYHETVSTSCGSSSPVWTVSADLQFWFSHPTAHEARVEYDFAPGQPTALSDIEIDEGSLRIIELPNGHIRVVTTKRVRFAGAFDGAGLAMFMCATGYTTVLEDLVFSVAKTPGAQPFPVPAPQGGTMSPQANQGAEGTSNTNAKANANPNPGSGDSESLDDLTAEAADFFASYLKDYAKICTSSLTSIQAGTYKVEDAWADGITLWTKYVSGLGKALDLGSRAAKAAAQSSPQAGGTPPAKTPEGDYG